MLIIERLSIKDDHRLRDIRLAALRDAPNAFAATLEQAVAYTLRDWQEQIEQLPTFIAVSDSSDCGMVRVAPHSEQPTAAYLISMWVAPTARGRGVGGVLIDAVADWARAAGYARLLLDVAVGNDAAVALYRRKGFAPSGVTGALPPPREHIHERQMALAL